ncbi:hypothetical protein TNCV_2794191 [Trichonephila clavipes]|nr:hypothetical protein TNCV_2794191 [Trichonephila clavipes]
MKQQRRYDFTKSIRTHKDIKDKRAAAIYTYSRRRAGDKNGDDYMVKSNRQRERSQRFSLYIPAVTIA